MAITNIKKGSGGDSDLEPRVAKNEEDILNHETRIEDLENAAAGGSGVEIGTEIWAGKDLDLSDKGWLKNNVDLLLDKEYYSELEAAFNVSGDVTTAVVDYYFDYTQSIQATESGVVFYHGAQLGYSASTQFDKDLHICAGYHDNTPLHTITINTTSYPSLIGRIREKDGRKFIYTLYYDSGVTSWYLAVISYSSTAQTTQEVIDSLNVIHSVFAPGDTVFHSDITITDDFFINKDKYYPFAEDGVVITANENTTPLIDGNYSMVSYTMSGYVLEKGYATKIDTGVQVEFSDYHYSASLYHNYYKIGDIEYCSVAISSSACHTYRLNPDGTGVLIDNYSTGNRDLSFFNINEKFFFKFDSNYNYYTRPEFMTNTEDNTYTTIEDLIQGYNTSIQDVYHGNSMRYRTFGDVFFNQDDYIILRDSPKNAAIIKPILDTSQFIVKGRPNEDDRVSWVYAGKNQEESNP